MQRSVLLLACAVFCMSSAGSGQSNLLRATAIPSSTWTKEPGVRIDRGPPGSPDDRKASTPHVIRLHDGTLRMYYSGPGILSAHSSDGFTWTKEPGIRVPVGIPGQLSDVVHPFVFSLPAGGYRMYYECSSDDRFYDIRSAVSPDGMNWSVEEGVRLRHESEPQGGAGGMDDPFVVEIDGGLRMYYVAFDGVNTRILSALSSDGLRWRLESGVRVDIGPAGSADQLGASHFYIIGLPDGRLQMYYSGGSKEPFGDSILSAVSVDGLTWAKEPGVRLDLGPPGSFDERLLLQPSIVQLPDGRFRMYYAGFLETFRILSAIAEPTFIRVGLAVLPRPFLSNRGSDPDRVLPVAILSAPGFHASYLHQSSLTFGRTGDEQSLLGCESNPVDVDADGLADVVCYFDISKAGLPSGDVQCLLKGKSLLGTPLAGIGSVRISSLNER